MANIAILGFGVVGSGVYETIMTNQKSIEKKAGQPVEITAVLDLREFPDNPVSRILTNDFNDILNDNEINVIVETMGGAEPAYTYVKSALSNGKSVVTSNKELVAKHGAELLELAKKNKLNFLFEASVGGGIPIIRSLNQSLTADEISEISAILNGTTNYMLTQMSELQVSYEHALAQAQKLGYAERDPRADVEGWDSGRKIAILMSLALGKQVDFEDILTEGITKITKRDIAYAKKMGGVIKLLASAKITNHNAYARVSPAIVFEDSPLYGVRDVFNAILIKGNIIGEVMFYGRGAGKLPTASAVVADVVDAVKHKNINIIHYWSREKHDILDTGDIIANKLIIAQHCVKVDITDIFGKVEFVELDDQEESKGFNAGGCELAFISGEMTEKELAVKLDELGKKAEILNQIVIG